MKPTVRGLVAPCRLVLLRLLLALGPLAGLTQTAPLTVGSDGRYPLSGVFSYFEDKTASLTLEQVLQAPVQALFKPIGTAATTTNFGATRSAIWLRVQLLADDTAPTHWLLEVANPALDRLDVYQSNRSGGFDHQAGGDSQPFSDRPVAHRSHVKPITLQPGHSTTLYLRIWSLGTVSAPTTLWQPQALWASDQQSYSVFSLYFGLLGGLLLYNLLLYLSVRDRAYLIYVAFVAAIGLSQASNSGLAAQFLWPDSVWWNNNAVNATNALSGTFGMLFACTFLASRVTMPSLDRWMRLLTLCWAGSCGAALLLPYRVAVWLVTSLALVGVATIALAGTLAMVRKHPGAQYFGLAWGALLLGVVVLTLHNNGFLPSNVFTANALLIGSSLEMVLLSFALADRINTARREKELAQAQTASEQALVQALQQSQEHYRAVIEHVGEGMLVVKDGRIVFVNQRASEIFEASRKAIVQQGVATDLQPDDRAMMQERLRLRLAGQPVPERCEVRLLWPDRPMKWLEVGDTTVPWDGGQGVLFFFLDMTLRHQADADTRIAVRRQQELNDLRSRFVSMTSHEFRTPLATILSSQDLLRHYHERLPAHERLELLGVIESGVHRMIRMLDRVLLLGKADAQMLEFRPALLDLELLCQALVHETGSLPENSGCKVVLSCQAGLAPQHCDEKLLRHILSNLLSNAVKYSPQGGEVGLRVSVDEDAVLLQVSDQGIGIPQGEIDHLFESFHRASNVGDIHGTGLGLAIVKSAVDLHGGTITVTSTLGQGTRFVVRLPGGAGVDG